MNVPFKHWIETGVRDRQQVKESAAYLRLFARESHLSVWHPIAWLGIAFSNHIFMLLWNVLSFFFPINFSKFSGSIKYLVSILIERTLFFFNLDKIAFMVYFLQPT